MQVLGYIKGDGKFYSLIKMDLFSHQVYIESQRTKQDRQIASSLLKCWKAMGLPDFLQIDNELSFHGSNRLLDIFGEKFKVSKDLVYSYVKAVIVTQIYSLQLYLGEDLVDTFDYQLTV